MPFRAPPESTLRTFPRRCRAGATLALTLLAACGWGGGWGCSARPEPIGDRGVTAYWAWGEVTTNLAPPWDQKTLAVATEDALRAKGYVIAGRTSLDADPCRIFARPGRAPDSRETVVTLSSSGGGTRIAIYARPVGDEGESKAVLRAILARVGLYGQERRDTAAAY